MISFTFRITDSFLRYPSHPITIPRSKIDYAELRALLAFAGDVWLSLPTVGAWPAKVYHGYSGGGEYYQVRCVSHVPVDRAGLARRDPVRIMMFYADRRIEVHMRRFTSIGGLSAA